MYEVCYGDVECLLFLFPDIRSVLLEYRVLLIISLAYEVCSGDIEFYLIIPLVYEVNTGIYSFCLLFPWHMKKAMGI